MNIVIAGGVIGTVHAARIADDGAVWPACRGRGWHNSRHTSYRAVQSPVTCNNCLRRTA